MSHSSERVQFIYHFNYVVHCHGAAVGAENSKKVINIKFTIFSNVNFFIIEMDIFSAINIICYVYKNLSI